MRIAPSLRLLPAFLFLLPVACATTVEGLRVDPSFTAAALREKPLVMAVVESAVAPLPVEISLAYAQEMRIGFLDQRPWLTTVDAGALRVAMGDEPYDALRESYRPGAAVGAEEIAAIGAALPSAGYAAFARVEENRIHRWRDRRTVQETRTRGDGSTYRAVTGFQVTALVDRRMTVSLSIVDLATGHEVWGGRVVKRRQEQRFYDRRTWPLAGELVELMTFATPEAEERFYPFPDPPDERALLRTIFAGFAENLPGKK